MFSQMKKFSLLLISGSFLVVACAALATTVIPPSFDDLVDRAEMIFQGTVTDVRSEWTECVSDPMMLENMLMFYDEVGQRLQALGIASAAELDEQRRLLRDAKPSQLPPAWALHAAVGIA